MPSTRKKAEGMAERFQRQIDRKNIERAKGKADIYREREWARETRNTTDLFSRMREQVMQTDITALERGATDNHVTSVILFVRSSRHFPNTHGVCGSR